MDVVPTGHGVAHTAHFWLPMADGVRLSASLWRPEGSGAWPAVLEIIPYRKRDHTATRDWGIHGFLAQAGFCGVRVDMRGTGDSEGIDDPHQTYADTVAVLAWMKAQPWCDGHMGMIGLSWGGINALMAAEQRPPGLEAVVATAFSHDRFNVGMARKNGVILNENLAWAAACTGFTSRPPDPAVVGEAWRDMWLQRLKTMAPHALTTLGRQRRDANWDKHQLKDPKAISAAFCMFSGQADSNYAQTLPHLMEALDAPRRATLGPWCHKYPHQAQPGPAIDFLGDAVAWFGQHLRSEAPQDNRPPFIAFIMEDLPTQEFYPETPGRWVGLPAWPPAAPKFRSWFLTQGRLMDDAPAEEALSHLSPQTLGLASGEIMPWFAYAPGAELPGDQRTDDGAALCFDTAPLDEAVDCLGAPELEIELSVDRPAAFLVARICDVKPDGSSARAWLSLHNLTQIGDERNPVALVPGRRYRLRLKLDVRGYRFLKGHRIRLALSTSYWPIAWPSPEPVTITVHTGATGLHMPLLTTAMTPPDWQPFGPPRSYPPPARTEVAPVKRARRITKDVGTGETRLVIEEQNGAYRLDDIDWTVASSAREEYRITEANPTAAGVAIALRWKFSRGAWNVTTEIDTELTCDTTNLHCRMRLRALEGEAEVFCRDWSWTMPRDHL